MKKGLKLILSVFICLLVVGSGFSAWYFSNIDTNPSNHNITGNISVAPIAGDFASELVISTTDALPAELYSSKTQTSPIAVGALNLTLDQGSNPSALTELIYFNGNRETTTLNLSIVLKISAPKSTGGTETERATADTETATKINALNPSVAYTLTLPAALSNYIEVNTTAVLSEPDPDPATTTGATIERTITYTLPLSFKYKENAKPEDSDEYDTMVTALTSVSYTLGFAVTYA